MAVVLFCCELASHRRDLVRLFEEPHTVIATLGESFSISVDKVSMKEKEPPLDHIQYYTEEETESLYPTTYRYVHIRPLQNVEDGKIVKRSSICVSSDSGWHN